MVPPLEPVHIQAQGPVPLTAEAVPTPHRFVVGAALSAAPLFEPQVPSTAWGGGVDVDGESEDPQEARKSRVVTSTGRTRIDFMNASLSLTCFGMNNLGLIVGLVAATLNAAKCWLSATDRYPHSARSPPG